MDARTCEHCGGGLGFKNRHARFCSSACRVRAHRAAKQLPFAMTSRARWVRRTASKRPITLTGAPASSTDERTWSTFRQAAASTAGAGLGYVLGDGVGCYDLDHCLDAGQLAPWALEVLAGIGEPVLFTEVSQSGAGLHVFVEAPEGRGRKVRDGERCIEFYSAGRYIAVTGKQYKP